MNCSFEVADRLAVHELMALYCHVVDAREFSRCGEIFTADAVYDVSDMGRGVHHGPEGVARLWSDPASRHPLAHHSVDVVVTPESPDTARVLSKCFALLDNGRAGSVTYRDVVVRTPAGWRIRERVVQLRRPGRIPPIT